MSPKKPTAIVDPPANCQLCPRLAQFRDENRAAYPDYFNGAVPSFGDRDPTLLIVGLAPGLQGANKTARPFTGDYAGDLLYATLEKFELSNGRYQARADDGLKLKKTMITNAVRCVPPQNKPVAAEIKTCRPFLINQIEALPDLRAILCLGKISHDSVVAAFGLRQKDAKFGHAAWFDVPEHKVRVFDSYHCSRYNTNTGRLTAKMFEDVFSDIVRYLEKA